MDTGSRARFATSMQRSAGNKAAQRALPSGHSSHADAPTRFSVQRAPDTAAANKAGTVVPRNEVELLGARLKMRQIDLAAFLRDAKKDVDDVRTYFSWVNSVYGRCFGHHELVVGQAGAQIESQQAWADFAFGLLTGVAVGVLAETAVAAAGIKLTYEVILEIAGEIVEGGLAASAKPSGPAIATVPDLAPALKSVRALTRLDQLNAALLGMAVPGAYVYSDAIVESERLTAELRVAEAGGARRIPDAEVQQRYQKLMAFDVKTLLLTTQLAAAETTFQTLRGKLAGRQAPTDVRCEQDIWIPWIAHQSPTSTSFFQFGIPLENKILLNHFVDIGLAARGSRGGRLNADTVNPHVRYHASGVSTTGPAEQLVDGAKQAMAGLPAYWQGVFLEG
jgi:hypothetical protein